MANLELRIAELRRQRGISQQQLAEHVGVTFQTVSKWETGTTMPDITMLPVLAGYFQVSVDQLLGLQPLQGEEYLPVESGTRGYWEERADYLLRTRKTIVNQDYIAFLVERVWQIQEPVKVLDCGCGLGFLASVLMPLLPPGSAYHGVDLSPNLITEGSRLWGQADWIASPNQITMECGDFLESGICDAYDLVICQAVLRHIGQPIEFLKRCGRPAAPADWWSALM